MNGELSQICHIVISARKATKNNAELVFEDEKYINSLKFYFLPRKRIFFLKKDVAYSVPEWFEICRRNGITDIKCLMPTKVKDRAILGFANTNRSSIVCFNKNGQVTYFAANWEFNREKEGWDVVYQEYEWKNPPAGKPEFQDNTEEFKKVLGEIENLAYSIGADGFAKLFHKAFAALEGNAEYDLRAKVPDIPKPYQNLYMAVMYADVYGAMGSWNDSPPYMAHEKGLDAEYDRLSDELLTQIRLATLYAVNEF